VGSAPQASETVFCEGPDDIVWGVQKALAPAMSEGNRNRRALELKSAVRQGAGLLPPMLCRPEGRKRNGEADANKAKLSRLEEKSNSSVQDKPELQR
jgi:hypothetical protein